MNEKGIEGDQSKEVKGGEGLKELGTGRSMEGGGDI